MSAFPPHKTLTSIRVSQEVAQKLLTCYLNATKTAPHLLPGARLEPNGISAVSRSSLLIHNLERVEAGLRGERVAPVLDLEDDGAESAVEVKVAGGLEGPKGDYMDVDGWQDLDEYQREQSIEGGELAPRQTGVAQEGDSEFEERVELHEDENEDEDEIPETNNTAKRTKTSHGDGINGSFSSKPVDKKARKKEKKLKLKEERKKRKVAK